MKPLKSFMKLTLPQAVVLALRRDMRLSDSELLSESSMMFCFRLRTGFAFVTGGLVSLSESLESSVGIFLVAVVDEGLGLERASRIDGCFTSERN